MYKYCAWLVWIGLQLLLPVLPAEAQTRQLDTLYEQAQAGSRLALNRQLQLTKSRRQVHYFVGRHRRKGQLGKLAGTNLQDLVVFSAAELKGRPLDFSRNHLALVRAESSALRYFPLYQHWGLSPLEDDSSSVYHARLLPAGGAQPMQKSLPDILFKQSGSARLDSLWQARNPLVLRELPRYVYARRHKGFIWTENVTAFMEQATGLQVGVQNYVADTVYTLAYDYYDVAQRNYNIFWARHYRDFRWNQQLARFEAPGLVVHPRTVVRQLLDQIAGQDSSLAFRAYTTLIEQGIQVNRAYGKEAPMGFFAHPSLPIFWDSFVASKQKLRAYVLTTGLPLTLPPALVAHSRQLLQPLSFGQRYRLENQLIQELSPQTVTAFELLMLDYQRNQLAQESVGRILDVLYSRHWPTITADTMLLALYLKKVRVYDDLGILGSCNNLKVKLSGLTGSNRQRLRAVRDATSDADVRNAARTALRPHQRYDSRRTFSRIRPGSRPAVTYNPDSLRQVVQQHGLTVYTGGQLNLARLDTALKYDAPLGFVGGHTPRTTTLEPLIQLLEAEFRTDLGFGATFGDWRVSGSPSVVHRARVWRWYLRQQGLIAQDHSPVSFVQENTFRNQFKASRAKRRLKIFLYRLSH